MPEAGGRPIVIGVLSLDLVQSRGGVAPTMPSARLQRVLAVRVKNDLPLNDLRVCSRQLRTWSQSGITVTVHLIAGITVTVHLIVAA
jgi:hypothetical protein